MEISIISKYYLLPSTVFAIHKYFCCIESNNCINIYLIATSFYIILQSIIYRKTKGNTHFYFISLAYNCSSTFIDQCYKQSYTKKFMINTLLNITLIFYSYNYPLVLKYCLMIICLLADYM